MIALEVRTADGTLRCCDAACHQADPASRCTCVCGGRLHGCGRAAVEAHPWEALAELRETLVLSDGEHLQLRFGA